MSTVTVVNKKRGESGEYVGRGSPLGNKFRIGPDGDRDTVIAKYQRWLHQRIAAGDERVLNELRRLYRIARDTGELRLQCHCAPEACHADVIREFLIGHLAAEEMAGLAPATEGDLR